jgi:MHS family proline/betaine transporter-like MFS transporter
MFFAALGGIAMLSMKETAQRPLLGSFPTVETKAEAKELVAEQDENELLDTSTMPLDIIVPAVAEMEQERRDADPEADAAGKKPEPV